MKVVITGGAGFIGTNLVYRLLQEDSVTEIRILDDMSTGMPRTHSDHRISVHEGSLEDSEFVNGVVEGSQRVIHLGALPSVPRSIADPRSSIGVNVIGTLNVLEAARRSAVGHVLSASSSSVYGANPALPKHEELPTRPLSPYAVSKLATESLTNAYLHSYELPTIAFRFFNVFGPLQRADHVYAAVIPKFLDAIKEGKPLTVHGDGNQSRDFTSVHVVVDALAEASLRGVSHPSPVNLAFGTRTTLNELISLLRELYSGEIDVEYGPSRAGDVPHSQASSALLKSLLPGLEPPTFEAAVAETFEWYMNN